MAAANAAIPFPGLTDSDLEAVRAEFSNLDFAKVYQKFVEYHRNKGTKTVTRKSLSGWFNREKPERAGGTSKPVKANKNYARLPLLTSDDNDVWSIGKNKIDADTLDAIECMPTKTKEDATKYLYGAVGYPWDVDHAFREYGDGWLFYEDENGSIVGSEVQRQIDEQEALIREAKKKAETEEAERRYISERPIQLKDDENWKVFSLFTGVLEIKDSVRVRKVVCEEGSGELARRVEYEPHYGSIEENRNAALMLKEKALSLGQVFKVSYRGNQSMCSYLIGADLIDLDDTALIKLIAEDYKKRGLKHCRAEGEINRL
jgi:hypothetical protein